MARKTRTFTDLDLNFKPVPSSQDRTVGDGTITVRNDSKLVTGIGSRFASFLTIDDNLYVKGSFIGKIQSIQSETQLTLYDNAKVSKSVDVHDVGDNDYPVGVSGALEVEGMYDITFAPAVTDVTEGNIVYFTLTSPNAPEGYLIDYTLHGIESEDLVLLNDNEYGITGKFVFDSSGVATIALHIAEDDLKELLETIIVELMGYALIIPSSDYKYSTPGDIVLRYDESAIKASIKHLICTMNYERPFNSKLGSQTRKLFFEVATPMTSIILKKSIETAINNFEPRVELLNVEVNINDEHHDVIINIIFRIVNTLEPLQTSVILKRTR